MRGAWIENSPAGQRLGHLAQDVHPAGLGLLQRLFHDLGRDARDLDVHLQRGDAVLGARDLEVHVAEVILVAKDVGQDPVGPVIFQDRPMATPATGAFSGTPASIIDSEPPQTDAIEDEPLDSVISDTTRIV
jgi:hypothetical protein